LSARRTALLLCAALALPLAAQAPLDNVTFQWGNSSQTGFTNKTPEVGRYDTLAVKVDPKFLSSAATKLGGGGTSPLEQELNALADTARALRTYETALTSAVAQAAQDAAEGKPAASGIAITNSPAIIDAATPLIAAIRNLQPILRTQDPATYQALNNAFRDRTRSHYIAAAEVLETRLTTITAELPKELVENGALGMTATIVPPDAAARALHLDNYDSNTVASAPAVPSLIPVVDDRTRRELQAAEQFRDVGQQLRQVPAELNKSVQQLQAALEKLRTDLKTNVLEAQLNAFLAEIKNDANTDLATVRKDVTTVRDFVHLLNGTNITLAGATDADKLLNLAAQFSTAQQDLMDIGTSLPAAIQKLIPELEAAVKTHATAVFTQTIATVKAAATGFVQSQTFFVSLANNLKELAGQMEADSRVALSAERLAETARALEPNTDYSTKLDLRTIAGDVHNRDQIVVQAALYHYDANKKPVAVQTSAQTFIVQSYGLFADSVRGGLLLVQPRSKIERDISYQPVPALGYYWRVGIQGHSTFNAASPSFGFTVALLDFKDSETVEIGLGAGITLLRNMAWVGYGRNLQARANYFYVGTNPLGIIKLFANR
jgi:hypothetical protein